MSEPLATDQLEAIGRSFAQASVQLAARVREMAQLVTMVAAPLVEAMRKFSVAPARRRPERRVVLAHRRRIATQMRRVERRAQRRRR